MRPTGEPAIEVTGSLVGGSVAVLLLAASVDDARLQRWVGDLSARYGRVTPQTPNGQSSWQWVRRQRMIRVTARAQPSGLVVSVSLVDGPLLDGLDGGAP
jgi:hypothetical protein